MPNKFLAATLDNVFFTSYYFFRFEKVQVPCSYTAAWHAPSTPTCSYTAAWHVPSTPTKSYTAACSPSASWSCSSSHPVQTSKPFSSLPIQTTNHMPHILQTKAIELGGNINENGWWVLLRTTNPFTSIIWNVSSVVLIHDPTQPRTFLNK